MTDPHLEELLHSATMTAGWTTPDLPVVAKLNYSHTALIDMILAHPEYTQDQLAAMFGYSPSWLSRVMCSDAFQAAVGARREQIVDPILRNTVEQNFKAMVMRSQEILMQKLSLPAHQVPDQLALRAFEIASRAAGYGAGAAPKVEVNVNNHLEVLGENLTKLLRRERDIVEGELVQPARGGGLSGAPETLFEDSLK